MFPEDMSLASGMSNSAVRSPSPEIDSEYPSARSTPEGIPNDIQLVKFVKWDVPNAYEADTNGPGSIRKAVPHEILPDSKTMELRKTMTPRRRSRKSSFEISSAMNQGPALTSDSELETPSAWPPSRCSPFSVDSASEKPEIEGMGDLSALERYTPAFSDDASVAGSPRLSYEGQSMRSGGDLTTTIPRQACQTLSGVTEAVQKRSARSSTDRTALKILGSRGLPSRNGNYDDSKPAGERGFMVSPLPSPSQLRLAKAVNSYDSESENDSVSVMESWYSDMMIGDCRGPWADCWVPDATRNTCCSRCDELHPRFRWLKRTIGPVTAIAGALVVFYAPRVLKLRQRQK